MGMCFGIGPHPGPKGVAQPFHPSKHVGLLNQRHATSVHEVGTAR